MKPVAAACGALLAASLVTASAVAREHVVIGSKAFPESWVLGEALALLGASEGAIVEHRPNLGGTEIVAQALRRGAIDAYPEYTGTLREVLLHAPGATNDELRAALARDGLGITDSLGFEDSYALAVVGAVADRDGLRTISDAAGHPELRAVFSHEFLGRADGWPGLRARYGLDFAEVRGVEHHLAFGALAAGRADVMDVYTTDPEIDRMSLRILDDDRAFFPRYDAVVVYRLGLETRAPAAFAAMLRLVGRVDRRTMALANAAVTEGRSTREAAAGLLHDALGAEAPKMDGAGAPSMAAVVSGALGQHLALVASSLAGCILVGIPLGILAARRKRIAALVLGAAGVLQTVPSLALLALLIPVLGIGVVPATVALFLYGLLPIVQGTCTGLTSIPAPLAEAAEALGLPSFARLVRVELPLASPSILGGVRTSAVIAVGTATIAALVGAGGLGDPILQGIALRSTPLILAGAVPAALLALAAQGGFALVERVVVPKGLRVRTHE
ncbi:MAG TPA: glycine betaine ABC transporter substrate-binding protein [Polyangiaceae bacterium]